MQDDPTLTSAAPLIRSRDLEEPTGDYPALVTVESDHYTIERELGRGGMGRIFRARDRRLGRDVAIKELLVHDAGLALRFEREARITARLEHPAIVNVHEAGRWPSGAPFYAMQLVSGKPLDAMITGSFRARLGLLPHVIAAADALAYAHAQHVIHRDLKPSNILCGTFGETVVIDWGLAKDLANTNEVEPIGPYRSSGNGSGETVVGAVLGTPASMPPEQAAGEPVDERADVYSLGAMLYHVLAGVPPYQATTSRELLDLVIKEPALALAERAPEVPADLAAIVTKAMARDPEDRFANANELALELKRFQTGQLVSVHHYSTREILARWLRRHRAAVATGALLLIALAAVAIIGVTKVIRARDIADHERALALAEQGRQELVTDHPARARPYLDAAWAAGLRTPALELERADARAMASEMTEVSSLHSDRADGDPRGFVPLMSKMGDHKFPFAPNADARAISRIANLPEIFLDADHVASPTAKFSSQVTNADGDVLGDVDGIPVAFAADRIVTETSETTRLWDYATHKSLASVTHPLGSTLAMWHGKPAFFAVTGTQLAIYDAKTGAPITTIAVGLEGTEGARFWTSRDHTWIAVTGSRDPAVWRVWTIELATGATFATTFPALAIKGCEVSSHGHIYVWDANELLVIAPEQHRVITTILRADIRDVAPLELQGREALGILANDRAGVYDAITGARSHWLDGHAGKVLSLEWAGNDHVVTGGDDGRLVGWSPRLHTTLSLRSDAVAIAPTGDKAAVIANGRFIVAGKPIGPAGARSGDVAWASGRAAIVDETNAVAIVPLAGGNSIQLPTHTTAALFDPHGNKLATLADHGVDVWDDHGSSLGHLSGQRDTIVVWKWLPSATQLVTGGDNGQVMLWTIGGTPHVIENGAGRVSSIAVSREWIAVGSGDGNIRIYPVHGGESFTLKGHGEPTTALAISSDDELLATGGLDGHIRLWALKLRHLTANIDDGQPIVSLTFRDDNTFLVSGAAGEAHLWNAETGALVERFDQAGVASFVGDDVAVRGAGGTSVFHPLAETRQPIEPIWSLEDGRLVSDLATIVSRPVDAATYDFSGDTIEAEPPQTITVAGVTADADGTKLTRADQLLALAYARDAANDPDHALQWARGAEHASSPQPNDVVHAIALFAPETKANVHDVATELATLAGDDAVLELANRYFAAARGEDALTVLDTLMTGAASYRAHVAAARLAFALDRPDRLVRELRAASAAATDADRTELVKTLEERAQAVYARFEHTHERAWGEAGRELFALLPTDDIALEKSRTALDATLAERTDRTTMNKAMVQSTLELNSEQLRGCYEHALRRKPGLAGTVTTSFLIDLDGHIGDLSVKAPQHDLEACMTEVMKKWRFAAPARRVQIFYPITFKSP